MTILILARYTTDLDFMTLITLQVYFSTMEHPCLIFVAKYKTAGWVHVQCTVLSLHYHQPEAGRLVIKAPPPTMLLSSSGAQAPAPLHFYTHNALFGLAVQLKSGLTSLNSYCARKLLDGLVVHEG